MELAALDRDVRARLRRKSKLLFGNADRLEVCYAVTRSSGLVHAQELANELGISPPRVRAQLLALAAADLLDVLPRSGQTQDYERRDSAFWPAIELMVEGWVEQ